MTLIQPDGAENKKTHRNKRDIAEQPSLQAMALGERRRILASAFA